MKCSKVFNNYPSKNMWIVYKPVIATKDYFLNHYFIWPDSNFKECEFIFDNFNCIMKGDNDEHKHFQLITTFKNIERFRDEY